MLTLRLRLSKWRLAMRIDKISKTTFNLFAHRMIIPRNWAERERKGGEGGRLLLVRVENYPLKFHTENPKFHFHYLVGSTDIVIQIDTDHNLCWIIGNWYRLTNRFGPPTWFPPSPARISSHEPRVSLEFILSNVQFIIVSDDFEGKEDMKQKKREFWRRFTSSNSSGSRHSREKK